MSARRLPDLAKRVRGGGSAIAAEVRRGAPPRYTVLWRFIRIYTNPGMSAPLGALELPKRGRLVALWFPTRASTSRRRVNRPRRISRARSTCPPASPRLIVPIVCPLWPNGDFLKCRQRAVAFPDVRLFLPMSEKRTPRDTELFLETLTTRLPGKGVGGYLRSLQRLARNAGSGQLQFFAILYILSTSPLGRKVPPTTLVHRTPDAM